MPGLTLHLEFITGKCVATQRDNRDEPEWPPHPGRVYMALAATCFETGEDPTEVAALGWLEQLPAPAIIASECVQRTAVKYYVPVNDQIKPNKSLLQTTPGLTRSKQERSFPTAIPIDPKVSFHWEDAPDVEQHLPALARLCSNTIRVGHSSSLVHAWLDQDPPNEADTSTPDRIYWSPTIAGGAQWHARWVGEGEFERLRQACRADEIEQFATLKAQIDSTKGKAQKEAKQMFESVFGEPYKASLRPPEPLEPVLGLWKGYQMRTSKTVATEIQPRAIEGEHFASELVVLSKLEGPVISVRDCLALTSRLRDALMSRCPKQPVPEWLSGHDTTGKPSLQPHVAFLALPYVGSQYADGHVMGLALAMPKHLAPHEYGAALGSVLFDRESAPNKLTLCLGKLGEWELQIESRPDPGQTLNLKTWTRPSTSWASVTPVVLDRFPRASATAQPGKWEAEVRATIAQSCVRAGLPEPAEVAVNVTSWHRGSPRAYPVTRRLHPRGEGQPQRVPRGDGFPNMPARPGKPSRLQVHVNLAFAEPVRGPVLIGAGRFQGYGLCLPVSFKEQRHAK